MPEITRFFGIIIRMYTEPGAPHHRPHFHAYYQNTVAVYDIDSVELIDGSLPNGNSVWSKPGPNCIKVNCWKTGNAYRRGNCPTRSPRSSNGKVSVMTHPIYRVVGFEIVRPYTLQIDFDDGAVQTIDFRPVLVGEMYGPLQDERLFNQVEIDPEVHTLVWPNGADFDPATLHDWPKYAGEIQRMAQQWATVRTKAA